MAAYGMRHLILDIAPPWLRKGVAERLLYTMGLGVDLIVEKGMQGVRMRMPKYADASALPEIGADRRMPRGLSETDASYARRLQQAFATWRYGGMPRAVMGQVLAYLGAQPAIRVVSQNSVWKSYAASADASAPPTHLKASPANWSWDTLSNPYNASRWFREWLIIDHANASTGAAWTSDEGTWGDGDEWGDDSKSWGLSVSPKVVSSIVDLLATWKSAHAHYLWMIVSFDPTLFNATAPAGDPSLPDGRWGRWSKTVVGADGVRRRVAARAADARYVPGVI